LIFWPVYFAVWLFLSKCSIGCFIETHSHNQWLIIESFKIVARFFKLNFNVEVWLQIWFFLTSILVYFAVWLFLSKCSIGCFMETHSHNQRLIIGSFKIMAQFFKRNFDAEVSLEIGLFWPPFFNRNLFQMGKIFFQITNHFPADHSIFIEREWERERETANDEKEMDRYMLRTYR